MGTSVGVGSSKIQYSRHRNGNTPPNISPEHDTSPYEHPNRKKLYGSVSFNWFKLDGSGPIDSPPPVTSKGTSPRNGDIFIYTIVTSDVYTWAWFDGIWKTAIPFNTTYNFGGTTPYVFKLDRGKPSWIKEISQNKCRGGKGKARA
jgi:hypothetical protein